VCVCVCVCVCVLFGGVLFCMSWGQVDGTWDYNHNDQVITRV